MPQSLSLCATLAIVAGIGACVPPPPVPPREDILFDSERDSTTGNQSIYLMAPDGSNVRRLAHVEGRTSWLADWSPDRKRIAFSSSRTGRWDDLYVMDANGGNVRQLMDTPEVSEHNAAWSPDEKRIAYDATPIAANGTRQAVQIWIIDVDGSNARPLTTGSSRNFFPTWSPDGLTIAFISDRHAEVDVDLIATDDGDLEVYLMESAGSNVRRLTNAPGTARGLAWSPDGERIAFDTTRDGNPEIYVMNADGSDQRRLTNDPRADARPTWSPDGREIAFNCGPKDHFEKLEICVIRADGSSFRTLTNNAVLDGHPEWR